MTLSLSQWQQQGCYFKFQQAQTQQHDIFYNHIDNKKAKTILFLHGFPSASHDYSLLVPQLSEQFNLLFIDFLGFGFSDKPRTHKYSLFEQADIVEALIAELHIQQVQMVSHDMGNSVALELIKRKQLNVEKMLMLNGSVLLKYYQPILSQKVLLHKVAGPILNKALGFFAEFIFKQQFASVFAIKPSKAEMNEFWQAVNHNHGFQIYYRLIQYLRERMQFEDQWFAALEQSKIPLSIVWGQLDPVSVPKIGEAIHLARPDASYLTLPSIGHYPQWEDSETVAKAIEQHFV